MVNISNVSQGKNTFLQFLNSPPDERCMHAVYKIHIVNIMQDTFCAATHLPMAVTNYS